MTTEHFYNILCKEVQSYKSFLETADNQWIVKGFIDINENIYTITNDTKVVSKIIEILLIPKLDLFAKKNRLELELPSKQNFYPDLTFKDEEGHLFAVDFKSSYYEGDVANGLTLGSYWGYFRNRDIIKTMDHTYNSYSAHIVLGILYKQTNIFDNEKNTFSLNELNTIRSVIENFKFFVQPKWKIASDQPGSGNTRNIGGIKEIQKLISGRGPFADLGEDVFDDYWMNYYGKADAKNCGIGTPKYNNLKTYQSYLKKQQEILNKMHK